MATSPTRPALQLFEQAFSQPSQRQGYAGLAMYLSEGRSIFPLVEQGVRGLMQTYELTEDDAKAFLEQANALAIYVRRQFIEHTLFSDPATAPGPQSGLLSMVEGPSFQRLFNVDFDALSPPDALESCYSPVAYLIDLLVWIRDKIEQQGTASKLALDSRRTDLKALSIDFNAVHQAVSAVDIIVAVLETFITNHGAGTPTLEDTLLTARYPNGLPYFQHWVSLDYVARHNGMSVGDIANRVDLEFPYFLRPEVLDVDAPRARLLASRLGPHQRLILTEAAATETPAFYQQHFGALDKPTDQYRDVPVFCERTKLDSQQLEALLSIRGFAPVRSANGPPVSGTPNIWAGSVYINAAASAATRVDIEFAATVHRLKNAPVGPIDRMNRKLRLDQWLGLPPEQTDALLAAAIKAELPANTTYAITDGGVQALGLFQTLRERYGCTAEEFAAFIHEVSFYGRGDSPSLFDRVFNTQGDYREPLVLDNDLFDILPAAGTSELTVNRLCGGLGIDLLTYSFVAQAVSMTSSPAPGKLARSAPVVSGFYRLVRLSRLLGITPIEGVLLLTVLGGESWVKALAGVPKIQAHTVTHANVLVVIEGLHTCVSWCREHDIEVRWLVQQVSEPAESQKETAAELQLFEQVRNLLSGALFTSAELLMAGVPALPAGADWLDLLSALVDAQGLVIIEPTREADYPDLAREILLRAVTDGLGERYEAERNAIVEIMLGVLLRAKAAQLSVVKECLAVDTGLTSEQVIPVLTWAGGQVDRFLRQVLARPEPEIAMGRTGRIYEGDAFLLLLAQVRRRSEIVLKLQLSVEVLQDYLDYGNREWITQPEPLAASFNTFYYLATLAQAFTLSERPQAQLLGYLREASRLPKDIVPGAPPKLSAHAWALATQAAAARLAVFFGWSVQGVLECAQSISQPLIRTLQQLDFLVRIRTLSARCAMDARTLLLIGRLPPGTSTPTEKAAYQVAAEKALLSLSETSGPVLAQAGDEPAQTVKITCVLASPNNSVIAGKAGEKVTYKVTVTNLQNTPMSGVFVHWQSTLGTIDEKATATSGVVDVDFIPGRIQGEETPLFWLDLGEKLPAPALAVIAESSSYEFPPNLSSEVPAYAVPAGFEVELYAVMEDNYRNRGINAPVNWNYQIAGGSGEAVIRAGTVTNQEGLARAFVSSPTGGSFRFMVRSASGDKSLVFDPITFLPGPPAA